MTNSLDKRLKILLEDNKLRKAVEVSNKFGIRFALFAGAHVSLLTKNRTPTDYDFLTFQEDLSILEREFVNSTTSSGKSGYIESKLVYPFEDKYIEFVGDIKITIDNHVYNFSMTQLAWNNVEKYVVNGLDFFLASPVDTIIAKAILQRGKDVGKNDEGDIRSLIEQGLLNDKYLKQRLEEVNVDKRVTDYLDSIVSTNVGTK